MSIISLKISGKIREFFPEIVVATMLTIGSKAPKFLYSHLAFQSLIYLPSCIVFCFLDCDDRCCSSHDF